MLCNSDTHTYIQPAKYLPMLLNYPLLGAHSPDDGVNARKEARALGACE